MTCSLLVYYVFLVLNRLFFSQAVIREKNLYQTRVQQVKLLNRLNTCPNRKKYTFHDNIFTFYAHFISLTVENTYFMITYSHFMHI